MADAIFEHPRLAQLYDALDPDRGDLDLYLALARRFGARTVLDVGCGTGTFALLLADRGIDVVGVDPAAASLDVARGKPGAERVRWIHGDARAVPAELRADLVTMTANVAQAIVAPSGWDATLATAARVLRPNGRLVFETRDPARRAWEGWTRDATYSLTDIDGVGEVEDWNELTSVDLPLVSLRSVCVFGADGAVLESASTLIFRERAEIERDLARHGFAVEDVLDAPDRPGREFVFVAAVR